MSLTVQDILHAAYAEFERTHAVAGYVRQAMWWLLRCGTGALGGYRRRCPDGHMSEEAYRSCRHRACARCAWRRGQQWLAGWEPRLLPGRHFQVVFTLPRELHPLWRTNRRVMAELLFRAVRETLFQLLADPKWLGARPGVLMALHTWSRSLALHPHIHCLLTAGGLTAAGLWLAVRGEYLIAKDVLEAKFRPKLVALIRRAWQRGRVALPPGLEAADLERVLDTVRTGPRWNIRIEPPYAHGRGLAIYLARYLCGGPIGNRRLIAFDGAAVTFVVGRQAQTPTPLTLPVAEFVARLAEHVPVPGLRMVRACGLYAAGQRVALAHCHQQLAGPPRPEAPAVAVPAAAAVSPRPPIRCCPVCAKPLVTTEIVPSRRWPLPRGPDRPVLMPVAA